MRATTCPGGPGRLSCPSVVSTALTAICVLRDDSALPRCGYEGSLRINDGYAALLEPYPSALMSDVLTPRQELENLLALAQENLQHATDSFKRHRHAASEAPTPGLRELHVVIAATFQGSIPDLEAYVANLKKTLDVINQ